MGTKGTFALEKNPFWKGGRSVASNGYVLLKMPDHPLADIRGYVYEHRLVACQILGRPLMKGEMVHHKDGNKQNNAPANLQIVSSNHEHRLFHRKNANLRKPGEDNPTVVCECGCGAKFLKFDTSGRPRKFISGHNPIESPTVDAIILALSNGPKKRSELVSCSVNARAVASALSKMKKRGIVNNIAHGIWKLNEFPE